MKHPSLLMILCLVTLIFCSVTIQAQTNSTTIIIEGSTRLTPNGMVDVKVNDLFAQGYVNNIGKAEITIPQILDGFVTIMVRHKKPYQDTANIWSSSFEANGSGYIIYFLEAGGVGLARQWPAVTWKGSKSTLDLYLNGSSKGSTQLTRGVEPERKHRFTWKRSNVIICDTTITLPFNVKRTCICDEQKRKVILE